MPNKRHPGRPKTRFNWDPCKVEGCENTTERGAKGLCTKHYMQVRRGMRAEDGTLLRAPQRVRSYGPDASCSSIGCARRPRVHGLCRTCADRANVSAGGEVPARFAEESRVLGHCRLCSSAVVYRVTGLCGQHHKQYTCGIIDLEGTQLRALKKVTSSYEGVPCRVAGCPERPINRFMCRVHHKQRQAGIIDAQGNQLREKKAWKRNRKERWVGRDGYALIKAPEGHPNARQDGSILEHRLVMSSQLGRPLLDHEVVHHRDGDRQNNDISNLELMNGQAPFRAGTPGHPPAHEFDKAAAIQVLLQQSDLPLDLRRGLESYLAA